MAVDSAIATRAADAIRATLATEMPSNLWATASDLVEKMGEAIAAGDGERIANLAAGLDATRAEGLSDGNEEARPDITRPPDAPGHLTRHNLPEHPGRTRSKTVVAVALIAVAVALLAVASVLRRGDAGDPAYVPTPTTRILPSLLPGPAVTTDIAPTEFVFGELNRSNGGWSGTRPLTLLATNGELTIELTWDTPGDVNLAVEEPPGTILSSLEPGPTSSGGFHGGNENFECDDDGSQETISWTDATIGTYVIMVSGRRLAGCGGPAGYELTVRSTAETVTRRGLLTDGEIDVVLVRLTAPPTSITTAPPAVVASDDEEGGRSFGIGLLGGIVAAVVLGVPLAGAIRKSKKAVAQRSVEAPKFGDAPRPLLPAPQELRELANHTIDRLDRGLL